MRRRAAQEAIITLERQHGQALPFSSGTSCFQDWIARAIPNDVRGKCLIAIDGKTCRRSHDAGNHNHLGHLHIVSAWAIEGIALGQVATAVAVCSYVTAVAFEPATARHLRFFREGY